MAVKTNIKYNKFVDLQSTFCVDISEFKSCELHFYIISIWFGEVFMIFFSSHKIIKQ